MLPHVLYRAPFYSSLYLEKLLWTLPMGMLTCIVSLGTLTTIPFPSRGAGGSGSPRRSLGGGTGPSPAIHSALLPSPPRCEAQPVAPAVKLQGAERAWLCAGSGQRYRSHYSSASRAPSHQPLAQPAPRGRPQTVLPQQTQGSRRIPTPRASGSSRRLISADASPGGQ